MNVQRSLNACVHVEFKYKDIYILIRFAQTNIKYLYFLLVGTQENKTRWRVRRLPLKNNKERAMDGHIVHTWTYQPYIPKFFETDNFASRLSDMYPSFAFSDFQRPWRLNNLSFTPALAL
jgi:hypothetical protein